MKFSTIAAMAFATAASAKLLGDDDTEELKLDMDDVPEHCHTICRPIADLSKQCDVDLGFNENKNEDLLHNQCVCTNKSFDVGTIAAECADCMHQKVKSKRDLHLGNHDDDDDIDADDLKGKLYHNDHRR